MTEFGKTLREASLPTPPAGEERALAAARTEGQRIHNRTASSRRKRVAAIGLGLVVALISPPGQAAIGWATELIGTGDVGGSPTDSERPAAVQPDGEQVVIGNGEAPDGTPFEVVAYKTHSSSAGDPDRGAACVFVDFPTVDSSGSGSCGVPPLGQGHFLYVGTVSGPSPSGEPSDPMVSGFVAESVDHVQIATRSSEAPRSAEIIRIDAATRERLDLPEVGFFLAFLHNGFNVQGLSSGREQLEVAAFDRGGALVAREVRGEVRDGGSPPESLLNACEEAIASGSTNEVCRELLQTYP